MNPERVEPNPLPVDERDRIGVVGSPSTTGEVTIDVVESASGGSLLGDLVYMTHPLDGGRNLLALGTVGEIETRNRWHEDPNMRGVLRVHGSLPHLSGDGDVRTAKVQIQAVYDTDRPNPPFATDPREAGGALGMSPATGGDVHRVDQALVDGLVARHANEVVYLGHVYRSPVRLPMYVRDFAGPATDGAFHTGIFGRSGSGKTAFATYLLAIQMRHRSLSFFVFDPQGQFTQQTGMVLDLQACARSFGRQVHTLSVAEDIRLPQDAPLALELLDATGFFGQLTIKPGQNLEAAKDEFERLLRGHAGWADQDAATVLRTMLTDLAGDQNALQRIYVSQGPRARLAGVLQSALTEQREFDVLADRFGSIHSLFGRDRPHGGHRTSLQQLMHEVLDPSDQPKPYVIVDLSARAAAPWLNRTDIKARVMRKIASVLSRSAEDLWQRTGQLLNCSVVFDEAHRFATSNPENDEVSSLSNKLVEYTRETRKTGLGWTFITQEVNSLHPAIYAQLRIRVYGYGLTSGSDLNRLRDEVGRGAALDLYQSFPDPNALSEKIYPFMLTGPVSPLSFTSAPVFLQVFTDRGQFRDANLRHLPVPQ